MCSPQLAAIGISTFLQMRNSDRRRKVLRRQQEEKNRQAREELEAGRAEEERIRRRGRANLAQQTSQLAAQGVDLSSGTALDLQGDTAQVNELDALIVRSNARRRANALFAGAGIAGQKASFAGEETILTGIGGGLEIAAESGAFNPSDVDTDSESTLVDSPQVSERWLRKSRGRFVSQPSSQILLN